MFYFSLNGIQTHTDRHIDRQSGREVKDMARGCSKEGAVFIQLNL